ncbi:hypothetical protein N9K47_00190 [bacterium]|nr:hypothetical protein [bacterium]
MDPAKLWVISERKINIANQVIAALGDKLRKECHGVVTGIRALCPLSIATQKSEGKTRKDG